MYGGQNQTALSDFGGYLIKVWWLKLHSFQLLLWFSENSMLLVVSLVHEKLYGGENQTDFGDFVG